MRPLNEREKRTVRFGAAGLAIYLALFYGVGGLRSLEERREHYQALVLEAEGLSTEQLRERTRAIELGRLREALRLRPDALRRETLAAEASAALQKEALARGAAISSIRELPGRAASKELAGIQLEATGPIGAATAFLHGIETLGFPLIAEILQLRPTGKEPGQVQLSLTLSLLDPQPFLAPEKAPEKKTAERTDEEKLHG